MRSKRKGILTVNSTNIYISAWVLAQKCILLKSSEIQLTPSGASFISYIDIFVWYFSFAVLLLKAVFKDKYSPSNILVEFGIFVLVYIVARASVGSTLVLYGLFVISLKNVDLKMLLKADMKTRLIVLLSLFLLSITGVINNFSSTIGGNLKYSFGWSHPNSFAFQILVIAIEYIYIYKKKLKLKDVIVLSTIIFALILVSANRTAILSFVVFAILYLLAENGKLEHSKIVRKILVLITPICGILSWLLVYLYTSGNAFVKELNEILTGRLGLSVEFLRLYPISLWGTKIETVSTRQALLYGTQTHILDMSYIRLPLEYGVVFFALFIILFIAIQIKLEKCKMYKELIITVFFSLVGIASNSLLNPFSNISFLFIIMLINRRSSNIVAVEKSLRRGEIKNV